MSKTAIVYQSVHHHNTEKIAKAISASADIDAYSVSEANNIDFSHYSAVCFASGIYFSDLHRKLYDFIQEHNDLPSKALIIYSSGSGGKKYANRLTAFLKEKNIEVIGVFNCKGFDTYKIFGLIGGIAKGHPDDKDINEAIAFVKNTEASL